MLDDAFREMVTVRRYADSLTDLTPAERDARLTVLAEFAAFVDQTPDTIVEQIFNVVTQKYRRRGFYSERIGEFQASFEGPRSVQLQRGNVIRAFFIANGRRVPAERPDWMTTPS